MKNKDLRIVRNNSLFAGRMEYWEDHLFTFGVLYDGKDLVIKDSKEYNIRLPFLRVIIIDRERIRDLEFNLGTWIDYCDFTCKLDYTYNNDLLKLVYMETSEEGSVCVFWDIEASGFVELNTNNCPEIKSKIDEWKEVMIDMALESSDPLSKKNFRVLFRLIHDISEN